MSLVRLPFEEYRRFLSTMPIVCVDCLVVNDRGEFLLVRRANEPLRGDYWLPGGRVHKGERLADAARRKMKEELGIDVTILENVGYFEEFYENTEENADGGVHAISFVFRAKPESYDIKLDAQSCAWGWFKQCPTKLLQYPTLRWSAIN